MTKTNERLANLEPQEDYSFLERENYAFTPKPKARFGKQPSKPDLEASCLLCDHQLKVRYIAPEKQRSQKNNWG